MKIVSVLRTSPEYDARHAKFLHDQLGDHDAVCLTNLPGIPGINTLPISDLDWKGWWAKMELFNPRGQLGRHDLFYIDVDTKIVEDIQPLMDAVRGKRNLVMLSDFYHPEHPASGVMFIPACIKRRVWNYWIKNWSHLMQRAGVRGKTGDQGVIAEGAAGNIERWDDVAPGAIVSYKKHVIGSGNRYWVPGVSQGTGKTPAGARIVCYHGKPRPWGRRL